MKRIHYVIAAVLALLLATMVYAMGQTGNSKTGKCYSMLAIPKQGTEFIRVPDLEYCREAMGESFDVFMGSLSSRAPGSNLTFTDMRPFYVYYGGIVSQATGNPDDGYQLTLMSALSPVNGIKLASCGAELPGFIFQTAVVYPNCEYAP
jgi:hypothetical protein